MNRRLRYRIAVFFSWLVAVGSTSISAKIEEGYIESESNVSVAPLLSLSTNSDIWSYHPDGQTLAKPSVSKQVRLLGNSKSAPSNFSISVLPGSKLALVNCQIPEVGMSDQQCVLLVCNLVAGQVETHAKVRGEKPLAISPDGHWIAMTTTEASFSKGSEIRLYQRNGADLKRYVVWRPYVDEDESTSSHTNVAWGAFLDNNRLLTTSDDGLLALWEVPEVSPLWCVQLERGSTPVVSPGGKYLAMIANQKLVLIDLESTSIVGTISSDLAGARLTFRPDGRRVAEISGDRICVWDLEAKDVYRDFNLLTSIGSDDDFAWLDDDHLLVGDLVIDIDRRVPIWKHMHTLALTAQDNRLWFITRSGKELTLASTRGVPQKAIDAVSKLKPEELLVIGPGTEVSVEISASGDVQSARDVLERKLKDNSMKVVSVGKVRLIGTVTPGEPREIRVLESGQNGNDPKAGTKHTVTEHKVDLCFKSGEQTIWRRSYASTLPLFINRNEGESTDQAIQRLTYLDASYLTGYSLPKCLARLPESLTK